MAQCGAIYCCIKMMIYMSNMQQLIRVHCYKRSNVKKRTFVLFGTSVRLIEGWENKSLISEFAPGLRNQTQVSKHAKQELVLLSASFVATLCPVPLWRYAWCSGSGGWAERGGCLRDECMAQQASGAKAMMLSDGAFPFSCNSDVNHGVNWSCYKLL